MMHGKQPPGFRLPAETTVGRVSLHIRDLATSLDFYHGLLGFEIQERGADHAVIGVTGEALIELHAGAAQRRGPRLGLYHFAILLPDRRYLGVCLRRLIESGIHPGAADHLVSEALYIQDPDGLGIEIYRDRPKAEWRVVGQQLAMASDPLDFEGVLQAGREHEWLGMPKGTRMGHVHLHVADLDRARDFYHHGLGLDMVVWSYPGALFLSAGGYHHHLGLNTWLGPSAEMPPEEEARLLWWDLRLPTAESARGALQSLTGLGFAVSTEADEGTLVSDPWGTKMRVVAPAF